MMTKFSNLAMGRQGGVKHGLQFMVETVQYPCVGEKMSKTGVGLTHQRLNACELTVRFC